MSNLYVFIFAAACTTMLHAQAPPPAKPELSPTTVVATTDGVKLTVEDVTKLVESLPPQLRQGYNTDPKGFLSQWFMLKRVAGIAEAQKLQDKPPLKQTLEVQRMTLLMQALLQEMTQSTVISPEELQKYYAEKKNEFAQAKVKLIYLPFVAGQAPSTDPSKKPMTEQEALAKAEGLVKQARDGKDFVALVKANSEDPISKEKDGDFGPVKRTDKLPDLIKNTIFQLKPGVISDPVRQPNGYYIFRLVELVAQSFEEVKDVITNELRNRTVKAWVEAKVKETELKAERPDFFAQSKP